MIALDYIVFSLVAFGIVYGVVCSSLFALVRIRLSTWSRWLEAFVYCPYCVGFWVGVLLRIVWFGQLRTWSDAWSIPECGFLAVGAIAILRAFAPNFLVGADYERTVIEELRGSRVPDAEPVAGSDDAEEDRHG
jgi:hypothetical protein